MTQKLDRRTRYTRSVIKQSFLELLQKYPFPKVTVTAICKKAEITRATFYLHYMDIYALLDAILEEACIYPKIQILINPWPIFFTKPVNQMKGPLSSRITILCCPSVNASQIPLVTKHSFQIRP